MYNPGVQDRSGEILAQGIGNLGNSIQQGMQSYAQNKTMAAQALGKFEGALKANPDLLQFLNPEEPSPNAPSDAVKAFMKLQKDGTLGVKDAALLSTFADTYTKAKEDKQAQEMRAQQMQQMQFQMEQQRKQQAEEDAVNQRMQQMARLGQSLEGGTQMQPAMQGGPAALYGRAPDGPMAVGGMDAMGRGGNLNGGGVVRPEVSDRAKAFLQTGAGQLAAQGVNLTPAQMVSLQQADSTRAGAAERASMAAQSRAEVQGLRNEMGGAVRDAKAEAQAAREEAKAATSLKKDSAQVFEETKKLRDEFGAKDSSKNFAIVTTAYNLAQDLAKNATPASDMAFVYAVMKAYDPRSTVREGERADASNAGSIPERIRQQYNKAIDGDGLTPKMRADFLKTLDDAAKNHHSNMLRDAKQYESIAKKRGLDPEEVIPPDYINWKPGSVAAPAATTTTPIKILSIKRVN